MALRDLQLRLRAIAAPRRVEHELHEELAFHIEREAQKHIASGLNPAEARSRALARFGSIALSADQTRDARGTAFVETLVRDVSYAFRAFRRAPLAALTIVATVGLGLGLVTVVFTVYNTLFLRADAVRNPSELFLVRFQSSPGRTGGWMPFTPPRYEALRRETGVFTDAVAVLRGVETRIDGRPARSVLVSGNFFQVLGVKAALGRALMPGDDELSAGRPAIVLSHSGWRRRLGADPAVIGRTLQINGLPYEVVGVMPEDFRGLSISPPDYWAPIAFAGRFRNAYAGKEDDIEIEVVGRLKPGTSAEAAMASLTVWASGRAESDANRRRFTFMGLTPSTGTLSTQGLLVFSPFVVAFGLILMIGCANVANLLLARGVARQREIGVRLSLGASRRRVVRQLLTENLLLALAAAACGLALSRLFLGVALSAATTTAPPGIAEILSLYVVATVADWRVLVFLIVGAVGSTVFFGLAPALQTTRLDLVRTMRGEVTRDARPGRARQALVAGQVAASALLLICAAIFLRGALAAATVDPGVRTRDTVVLWVTNEPRRTALLQAVTVDPAVTAVAASSREVNAVAETTDSKRMPVAKVAVSPEYFDVLDILVVRGRGFTQAERREDAGVAVVSETTARRLWPDRDALGQVVRLEDFQSRPGGPSPPRHTLTVVGVVRDMTGPLVPDMFPSWGVYVPTSAEQPGTSLTLRVRGNPDQARQDLLERLTRADPALGQINSLKMIAGMEAYILRIAFWVAIVLGGFALVLTVSGLFGVLSYLVEQRAKDIGVRMALGATARSVSALVLSQTFRPVGIGLAAGGGLAAALATVLTASSAVSPTGGTVRVFDPVAYGSSLLIIVTACALAASVPALRAARIDPIATLRKD